MQTTIRSSVSFDGVGLHSGQPVRMTVLPAVAEHGIWFKRTDIHLGDALVPARWNAVVPSSLCTLLRNPAGVTVSTVEHVMAALAGCGIHNAMIEINGPEVPILDGSALPFVQAFLARGVRMLDAPLRMIEVLRPVRHETGAAWAELLPAQEPLLSFHISFPDAAIGTQEKTMRLANGAFVRELCDSRTFCRQADVDFMLANGLAQGGEPGRNAVVFDGADVVSPGGLRHADEPVRHKMLDAVGDLALAGFPILGHYRGMRAGHGITNGLLRALFADPTAFRHVECDADQLRRMPGSHVSRLEIPRVA